MAAILVLTTFPDAAGAQRAARKLVSSRLAACATVVPGVRSVYRWKGKVERAREAQLIVKTSRRNFRAVERAILQGHPYELPEVLALGASRGSKPYLKWLDASSR
jgi:periplasmic divalent cation tolerance protein